MSEWTSFAFYNASCPGRARFDCPVNDSETQACAYWTRTQNEYCCPSRADAACYTPPTPCRDDDSTMTCSSGGDRPVQWCCLAENEVCTEDRNQHNVCWAIGRNPLVSIGEVNLNAVFSSLSSENPTASVFSFDPSSLLATFTTSSTPQTSNATPTPTSSETMSPTNTPAPSSDLSQGAITGIGAGVGVAGGLVLIALIAWLLMRRRRKNRSLPQYSLQQDAQNASPQWSAPRNDENKRYTDDHSGANDLSFGQRRREPGSPGDDHYRPYRPS